MDVVAGPAQGIGPLTITFTVNNRTGNAISSIQADFLGTGFFINLGTNPQVSRVFTTPGTFQANFIITDSTGATFRPSAVYVIDDAAQIDTTLRAAWNGFTSALAARDTTQALQFFNAAAKTKYAPALNALSAQLPQIVGSFSSIKTVSLGSTVGEYALNRTIDGINRLFLIYFLQDTDGVWRLDSM
jgi:PKD repeat protein